MIQDVLNCNNWSLAPSTAILGSTVKEALVEKWIGPLKIFSHVVVLLMLLAIFYAAFISITYWSGISV